MPLRIASAIASSSAGRYARAVAFRCSRHSATDHTFGDGRQMNWSSLSGEVSAIVSEDICSNWRRNSSISGVSRPGVPIAIRRDCNKRDLHALHRFPMPLGQTLDFYQGKSMPAPETDWPSVLKKWMIDSLFEGGVMTREEEATLATTQGSTSGMTREETVAFFKRREEAYEDLDAAALAADYAADAIIETPSSGRHIGR